MADVTGGSYATVPDLTPALFLSEPPHRDPGRRVRLQKQCVSVW